MMDKNGGFTLIEVLAVTAILFILCAISVPSFLQLVNKGRETEATYYLGILIRAQKAHRLEQLTYQPHDLSKLNEINTSKAKYYQYSVDPSSSGEGVFMRATPRTPWQTQLRSYFAAVVLFEGADAVDSTMICKSKVVIGGHLKKSDLNINSKDKTLACKNNSVPI